MKCFVDFRMMMVSHSLLQSEKHALRERVKELTCLYDIAQIASKPNISLENILQGIVKILPSAWQDPKTALARLVLDGTTYKAGDFPEKCHKQSADIVVNGNLRGFIEIGYDRQQLDGKKALFLTEEKRLLNEIARQIAIIAERKQAEEVTSKLCDQLRHADRLATVGMLVAGVAHELNEPLGNILGFAQLAKKCAELPMAARQDIEKIEMASLHSREIIQKLLVFAGQVPAEKKRVNLNEIVEEGLYFFNARCVKKGIELVCNLCHNLPEIMADPVQLNQVLVNLVVNALQSMQGPGSITVKTKFNRYNVCLFVEDTGPGINKEVLEKIFIPFFTTKDIGLGTGLGLPVVHGIVTSHGGSINVESKVGRGTCFEIHLPLRNQFDIKGNGLKCR